MILEEIMNKTVVTVEMYPCCGWRKQTGRNPELAGYPQMDLDGRRNTR